MLCPKPASLGIPLDVTSAHPPEVHLSWLVGTINRVQGLSTHREHPESAKATLVNRFRRHHAPSFLIELLNRIPFGFPSHIASNLVQRIDEECAMATTLQHGFWGFVSLCAPVVVQCTAFTSLCHQPIWKETGKVQVHQNHFHQKKFFIKIHFHQKPLSSKTTFIKNHFHQKTTFIKNQFHQRPISSETTFIKNHFHQKPISSKTNFIRALPVRGTHHPSKNNIVRVCVKASRAEGPRRLHTNTACAHLWTLSGPFC